MKDVSASLTRKLGTGFAIAFKCKPRATLPWRSYIRAQQHALGFLGHVRKATLGTLLPGCPDSHAHYVGMGSRPPSQLVAMRLLLLETRPTELPSCLLYTSPSPRD